MKKTVKLMFQMVLIIFATVITAVAQTDNFNATNTFIFDPGNTGAGVAVWHDNIGLLDENCRTNFGLRLEKNAPTSTNVAVGAEIRGLRGETVQTGETLGYDIKNNSPCRSGSPRFNVEWRMNGITNMSFVGGCANDTERTLAPQSTNWTRTIFELQDPTESFPVIPAGARILSVAVVVDDSGQYTLDNIQFRQRYADRPGRAGMQPFCP